MLRRDFQLLVAVLLLSACHEEVPFPAPPPYGFELHNVSQRLVSTTRLQGVAGTGAEDCGLGRDRASTDRVYDCAARALREKRPFFCRYDAPASVTVPYASVVPIGRPWNDGPSAFAGTIDGVVTEVSMQRDGTIRSRPVLGPTVLNPAPVRMHAGMTPPRLLHTAPIDSGERVHRMVFVEVVIDARGVVSEARLADRDFDEVDKLARDAVAKAEFEPARFFGVPRPVVHGVVAHVENGVITLRASPSE